jgi:hypothetical protein
VTLAQKSNLLVEMFGEEPSRAAVRDYAADLGKAVQSGNRSISPTGRVLPLGGFTAPLVGGSAFAKPAGHTFFGDVWKPR